MRDLQSKKLADAVVVNDEDAHTTQWVDISDAKLLTLIVHGTKTLSPGNLTIKLQYDTQPAKNLNAGSLTAEVTGDMELLYTGTGATSKALAATGAAVGSKRLEERYRSCRLHYTAAATTNATNYWTLQAQLNLDS